MLLTNLSGDQHDLPSGESLTRENARLSSSSHSTSGGGRSPLRATSSEKIYSQSPPTSNQQRKARMWHEALQRKRRGAEMMLAAQKVIEEVEEEMSESVPRDIIDKLHAQYYDVGDQDDDSTTKTYIATISAVRVSVQQPASTSGDGDLRSAAD